MCPLVSEFEVVAVSPPQSQLQSHITQGFFPVVLSAVLLTTVSFPNLIPVKSLRCPIIFAPCNTYLRVNVLYQKILLPSIRISGIMCEKSEGGIDVAKVKFTTTIDDEILQWVKIQAIKEKRSVSDLLEELIRQKKESLEKISDGVPPV